MNLKPEKNFKPERGSPVQGSTDWGPVHTNPFSNENGVVLLRFQKELRPHLSFSYRFRRPSTLQRRIRFENAFIPSVRMLGPRNWREIEALW